MPPPYFPLRWESTGEQWWYASPIDCAAANGHYDLVRELLYIDANLLIKLTSLRRIRRLETVWDDLEQFNDVAACRAYVAKNLVLECEISQAGQNSLIRAGYGGWLLYTAASAGDVGFVQDLLEREPLLVFGEGEYGITDILYAAARSKSSRVFTFLMDIAIGMSGFEEGEFCDGFRWEIMNRAVHSAAKGGNLEVLKALLPGCSDVLAFRDSQGSTILHSAAGRGQPKVVKELIASYNIISSTDHQGNTALHIAAYRGFLPVVETLLFTSPSLASSINKQGNTFLHMAVAGFQAPGFHRVDQQLNLIKQLVSDNKIINIQDIVNSRNNQGRTALHLAVIEHIRQDVVELLITVPSIDLNIKDGDGMTPIDLLKRHPHNGSSKLLIKQMVGAGAFVSCQDDDHSARGALANHLKLQGISPGASFRVPDSEIFSYTVNEDKDDESEAADCSDCSAYSGGVVTQSQSGDKRLKKSRNSAAVRLKVLLQWPKRKDKAKSDVSGLETLTRSLEETHTSLRQRFSRNSSLPNSKRVFLTKPEFPSPSAKKTFTSSLMQGVLFQQPLPRMVISSAHSPPSPFSESSMSSPGSAEITKGVSTIDYNVGSPCSSEKSGDVSGRRSMSFKRSQSLLNKKLMNHYLCFGTQGLAVEDSIRYTHPPGHFQRNSVF